jgi:hypothetical protein
MLFQMSHLSLLLGASTLANAHAITSIQKRDTSAQVTLGRTRVPMSSFDGQAIVGDALRELCSGAGCDSGTTFETETFAARFKDFGDIVSVLNLLYYEVYATNVFAQVACKWNVKAAGNYDSTDERDYMIALLTEAVTASGESFTIKQSIENPTCTDQGQPSCDTEEVSLSRAVNFIEVVLNLDDGANKGQMNYNLGVSCETSIGWECGQAVTGHVKDALSAVPAAGPVFAQVIDLFCSDA